MKTLTCVCLPGKQASSVIERISKDISKKCVSKKALEFQPHFTVRGDFKIEEARISDLKNELQKYCKTVKSLNLHLTKYGFYPWKIIFLDIVKNADLQNLHNKCMDIIEKHRESWVPEMYINNDNFKGKQKEYTLKHRYHFCYEFFSPHFTVAGNDMTESSFQKMKKKLSVVKEDINVSIKELVFFDKDNGNKIFMKIDLG